MTTVKKTNAPIFIGALCFFVFLYAFFAFAARAAFLVAFFWARVGSSPCAWAASLFRVRRVLVAIRMRRPFNVIV